MKKHRWLILIVCSLAALACYSIGFAIGLGFFVVAGVGFELAFWFNLLKRKNN
jgi:hypothetical protein